MGIDKNFFIKNSELSLRFTNRVAPCRLAFKNQSQSYKEWSVKCKSKLRELLNISVQPKWRKVHVLRETIYEGVSIKALLMQIDNKLSIPAYLLTPLKVLTDQTSMIIAIHGHGEVEPCIGQIDDYHHQFALELAIEGHSVLCPELRGFGSLSDLAIQLPEFRLDYWNRDHYRQFTLVSDAFIHGNTLIGQTVEDLLRWEDWLINNFQVRSLQVAGISYGGDLALIYPVFSNRVDRIFASGTLGSFYNIYSKCYNAPAHCIPGILQWMDRSDIAGLNAPCPMAIHYGELDVPSKENNSAAFNDSVNQSFQELIHIYRAAGNENNINLIVSPGTGHEMDVGALKAFFSP